MGRKKIAVIDDEKDVVIYLTQALQDGGFEVCSATNANDGFKLVQSERPDLVCIDILMPEKTGLSVYKKIRQDQSISDIPVVIISGLNMGSEIPGVGNEDGNAEQMKPDGFIEKPINVAQLIETIQSLTNSKGKHEQA